MTRTIPAKNSDKMTRTRRNGRKIMESRAGEPKVKFQDKFIRDVYLLAMLGARNDDVAKFFEVAPSTVNYWMKNNKTFREASKAGKMEYDMKVVQQLGRRALGYDYTEKEVTKGKDKFGSPITTTKTTYKHMPPDVTALRYWLNNRQREIWSDVNKHEIVGRLDVNKRIDIALLSQEQKHVLKQIIIKQMSGDNQKQLPE